MNNRLAFAALAALSAACSSAPYAAYAIENDAELVASVVVSESSLQNVVRVGRALVARLPGGELKVVVPIRNIDDEQIQVLAQISFRDEQRRPVGDTSNRQVLTLAPGATLDVQWISTSVDASDYVVRLHWNK